MQTQKDSQWQLARIFDMWDTAKAKKTDNKPIRIFMDADLRGGHDGLTKAAKKEDIDVRSLGIGEFVLFVNRAKTGVKIFAPANIIVYLKMPRGERLNMRAIRYIPRVFNAAEMKVDYQQALTLALDEQLRERQKN